MKCINSVLNNWCSILLVRVKIALFCFRAFAHYFFILQARIAETRKYVRASVGARKQRGPVYLVFARQC